MAYLVDPFCKIFVYFRGRFENTDNVHRDDVSEHGRVEISRSLDRIRYHVLGAVGKDHTVNVGIVLQSFQCGIHIGKRGQRVIGFHEFVRLGVIESDAMFCQSMMERFAGYFGEVFIVSLTTLAVGQFSSNPARPYSCC